MPRNMIILPGHRDAVLMLHGFPSEPVAIGLAEKNIDLAYKLNQEGHSVYLVHYEGLGLNKDGQFSFRSSIEESLRAAEYILTSHQSIILLGHSWGGYVSLALNKLLPSNIKKTILLSPFFFLPSKEILYPVIDALCADVSYILKNGVTSSDLTNDLFGTDQSLFEKKEQFIVSLRNTIIYHAANDNEVPIESSQKICDLNPNVHLKICDTDHGFRKDRDFVLIKS